jgi:hypothetical protein
LAKEQQQQQGPPKKRSRLDMQSSGPEAAQDEH